MSSSNESKSSKIIDSTFSPGSSILQRGVTIPGPIFIIDVTYDAEGWPSADPHVACVASGTHVIWRGPSDDLRKFRIEFIPDPGPAETCPGVPEILGQQQQDVFSSSQKAMLTAMTVPQTTQFRYQIVAIAPGGTEKVRDPIIIVRP